MFIFVHGEPDAPVRTTLAEGETVVGRAPDSDIVLDHPSVSRRHAVFIVKNGSCTIVDQRSSNSSFVNGAAIDMAEVKDGDRVIFGEVAGRIEAAAGAP